MEKEIPVHTGLNPDSTSNPVIDLQLIQSSPKDGTVVVTWSEKEEKAVKWKLDLYLMPLLVLGFFVLQLDRSNISNALTDTILKDIGITSNQVNVGNQLLSAGVLIAELPSNLVLQKLGAPRWLTIQMAIWGTIALAQSWCTNLGSFYATRFLLGLFEGGYIPGCQYVLALFYTEKELATRTAIFYFGNYFASAVGSLIAAGLLKMAGINGLAGWQWLFIIEGAFTLVVFLVFVLLMPSSPYDTQPIHRRFDFFTERDREILQTRVLIQDRTKLATKANLSRENVLDAVCDFRLWLHALINIISLAPKAGLQLYSPSIIKSLGFDKTRANLLNSVSSFLVIVLSFAISFASDKTSLRGPWCIVAFIWSIAFAGALMGLPLTSDKWTRYAIITLLSSGNALAQGLNDAWVNINATSPHKRSIGLAFVTMGSSAGGIIGPQLFQSSDSPRYLKGFLAILILYACSSLVTMVLMAVYWRDNKRKGKASSDPERRFQI